jgi:phospholipid-binding lipoprotein MlaA
MTFPGLETDRRRLLAVLLLGWAGALTTPAMTMAEEADDPSMAGDPLKPVNTKIFAFNDTLDRWVLKPVAQGYDKVAPEPVQRSIGNVFDNLGTPATALNQFLQGKPKEGLVDVSRFLVNSTVGIAGLFDVAARMGLSPHTEDFGQTFRVWGIGRGPFLMLPLRGPATTTHAVGMVLDAFTNPLILLSNPERPVAVAVNVIDTRAQLLEAESFITGDRYLFVRDAYLQNREFEVNDGVLEEDPFLDDFDDFED